MSKPMLPRHTERLLLRPIRRGDEADLLAYRSSAEVCRYIPTDPLTAETVIEYMAERMTWTKIEADDDKIVLVVELAGRVIGDVLVRTGRLIDRQAEIGWVLNPEFQHHGYATEAARELAAMSFSELGMHRVWAQLDPRNGPSARICERLGMRHEGHLREDMWLKGAWCDAWIYAILESEWPRA